MRQKTRIRSAQNHSSVHPSHDFSIVALERFVQATRESGYKSTSSALSELVDNSIQAGATRVELALHAEKDGSIEVHVLDDGCGMDRRTLREALRFGGSTRFGQRDGMGRFGMGLPNASLSQARHLDVYTWQGPAQRNGQHKNRSVILHSYLDVDDIVAGKLKHVPSPTVVRAVPISATTTSGTLVVWKRCDRLDNRRISTLVRKIAVELGRRFRYYLWDGLQLTVNGSAVLPFDPLHLNSTSEIGRARLFGHEEVFEIMSEPSSTLTTGRVTIRFSELPVHDWHALSNDEKRRRGVTKGAGVSIVRSGREVDFGWFFMGGKRKENYDDWWRCEILFEPVLDEAFGITHTKQQIRPRAHLVEALSGEIEATARILNARARKAHAAAKSREQFLEAERVASERDHLLRPLPRTPTSRCRSVMTQLTKVHPALSQKSKSMAQSRYLIVESSAAGNCFFSCAFDGKKVVLVLNPEHPFYRDIYGPLKGDNDGRAPQLRSKIDLLLLAAARSEVVATDCEGVARHREDWSNALAAFLNK